MLIRSAIATAALVLAQSAGAAPYSDIVVFGDSLSDVGRAYALTAAATGEGYPPSPPYYQGRFSNGPVGVEYLAAALGLPLSTANNFAHGGATTAEGNIAPSPELQGTGLQAQLRMYGDTNPSIDATQLFFVWAGANDLSTEAALGDPTSGVTAARNVLSVIGSLEGSGARQFFVPLLPDLGLVPDFNRGDPAIADVATQRSVEFNDALREGLDALMASNPELDITVFDTFEAIRGVFANPAAFGFADLSTPCLAVASCVGDPAVADTYFFWDGMHPSARAHEILGQQFIASLFQQQVPEPRSAALALTALALLGAMRRLKPGPAAKAQLRP